MLIQQAGVDKNPNEVQVVNGFWSIYIATCDKNNAAVS